MIIEDFIDAINTAIWNKRFREGIASTSHLVLHKRITPAPTFKAYRIWDYTVWIIEGNIREKIFTFKVQERALTNMEEMQTLAIDKKFLSSFMEFVFNNSNSIINGEWSDLSNEQVPDPID